MVTIKDITCYDIKDYYTIDTRGNVYSKIYNKYLSTREDRDGYLSLSLCCNDGKRRHFRVHRLVAGMYIDNPENYPLVMHLDNNVKNNCVENLRWGTTSHNTQQAFDDGLIGTVRAVELLDLKGNIIKEFISVSECSR